MNNIGSKFESAGIFFLVAACFFIPLSSAMMGATSVLACVCWLFSGKVTSLPRLMLTHIPVLLATLLFLLLIGGLFYSPVEIGESLSYLKKYRELLFIAMVVSLFRDNSEARQYAEYSFISGCVLLLAISYAMYFSFIPMEKYGYSTVYHITHSLFMAFLAFWFLQQVFNVNHYIVVWLLLFIATSVNLLYIAPGRTGMLIYLALILLTLYQRVSVKKSILLTVVALFVIGAAFTTSKNFSTRVNEAIKEIQTYQTGSSRTSLGMRFDWWLNSLELIQQKPVFGHGTGSFKVAQKELIKESRTQPTDNPHNEYLLIGVQTGLVGLALFVALLGSLFFFSFKLPPPRRYLLQGVVVAMACGCLMNSFLYDSHPGHFFAILSAVFCTPIAQSNSNSQEQ